MPNDDDDDDDDDRDELTAESIDTFGITFSRPKYWEARIEAREPPTYLWWDEDCGSFRITPMRFAANFELEPFLEGVFAREQASGHAPIWRTLSGRRCVAWIADAESRCHFYVTGRGELVITISYAYDPDMLDDDYEQDLVEIGLEQVDAVLASLVF